jgi:peptide-methionine (S)-S-oxide reductase
LLHERAIEPECYPRDYFRDPKLFWFIANNPTLMPKMPVNIAEVGRAMIARGAEQPDLDYTLELVMSNGSGRKHARQDELIALLLEAGAKPTPRAILVALAHDRGIDAIKSLLNRGVAMSPAMAAALGRNKELASLLVRATPEERQNAFAMAVVNMRVEAARLCLDAGADPNAFVPVHRHATPLHQAALNDDVGMLKLLVARGARLDTRDTLWNDTPLGWAVHTKKRGAEAYLCPLVERLP